MVQFKEFFACLFSDYSCTDYSFYSFVNAWIKISSPGVVKLIDLLSEDGRLSVKRGLTCYKIFKIVLKKINKNPEPNPFLIVTITLHV